jgi:glycosyltransferase involved in cell wall biosynthesis
MNKLPRNVAFVYDRVNKWGGAERVLLALHDLFPSAPLYTSVYNSPTASWAKVFPEVIPSFMQNLPLAKSKHEIYPWLTPLAFESLHLNQYEAVISITSSDAKAIITHPETFHLCYCLTPTRYLWSHQSEYQAQLDPNLALITKPLLSHLRAWDLAASHRPDSYVAISKTVQSRITTYYHQASRLVYPPVDIDVYSSPKPPPNIHDFFLYVGRLVFHKRPDTVINVFNQINIPLVVVGTGIMENYLKKIARPNITFTGLINQSELTAYYQHSKAVIFFHEEDFGLVPVEAHAAGKPVIALNRGGASEVVIHGQTGLLLDDPSESSLKAAVLSLGQHDFDPGFIKNHATNFSLEKFRLEFVKIFAEEWAKYKNKLLLS